MADSPETSSVVRRFLINTVGVIGLVFGALPIVRYLFESEVLAFTDTPYRWLQLGGSARFLPPVLVLVSCIAIAFVLERQGADG